MRVGLQGARMKNALLVAVLLLVSCVHATYTVPVTGYEAMQVFPGVAAAAESQGLKAFNGGDRVQVQLLDGTDLFWIAQNTNAVTLNIILPGGVPDSEQRARIDAAKQQADVLWREALGQRQQFAPMGVVQPGVVVAPVPAPPPAPPPSGDTMSVTMPGMSMTVTTPPGTMAPPPPGTLAPGPAPAAVGAQCRRGSDGIEACGYDCRISSRGQAFCAATPDGACHLNSDGSFSCGRTCRLQATGYYHCR